MRDSEDSNNQNNNPDRGREEMEERYAHYKSYFIQPGDEMYADIYVPKMHSGEAIAERIVILTKLLFARSTSNVESQKNLFSDLKRNWWFKATPMEQAILDLQGFPDLQDQHAMLYREILNSLLWTLNQEQIFKNADGKRDDSAIYPKLSEIEADNASFIGATQARPVAEILQARADNYKAYMESKLEFDANEGDSYDLAILEFTGKYVALSWVLQDGDWDELLGEIFESTFYLRADGEDFDEGEESNEEDD